MTNIQQNYQLTNYQQWQLENRGDILSDVSITPEGDLYESGIEELNRLAEWIESQTERQLMEAAA